jgi:hypothetical protein
VIAYERERGGQRVADATEVVQERRLVEAPRPGYPACAGAGESSRLQRPERGRSDPRLRPAEVKELAAAAAVEDPPCERAYADARLANLRQQDAASGSLAKERRGQLRGLWAGAARAQQTAGEGIGPTGPRSGDFPQAFTRLAPSSAAGNLDRQFG